MLGASDLAERAPGVPLPDRRARDGRRALADLAGWFVAAECARLGVSPGSEDLLLRPINEAAESMCDACGLAGLPPGAAAPNSQ